MNLQTIFSIIGVASICVSTLTAADLPRLAVLAEDMSAESRNMADLIQAELSGRADVEMVERAEIERVLREQELTAAGLTDAAARVRLGQILKAKGLIFAGPRNARVVETSDGFLAGSLSHPQHDTLTRTSVALSVGVAGLLPKLMRNPELHTCVSVLRFNTAMIGTAGAHGSEARFDAVMLERLTAALCAEPDVLVMERRRTGDLRDEASLVGERSRLKSGSLLIDGELASALMENVDAAKPSVTLTVRVRDLTGREIAPIVVRGLRAELDTVIAEAVFQTVETVRHNLRIGSQDTLKAEVETLMALARRTGVSWANEAAFALDPKNTKARDEFLLQLYKGISDSPMERYYGYARMEQILREAKLPFHDYMYLDPPSDQLLSDLSAEESHFDPELVALLRPLRQEMERIMEKSFSMKHLPNKKGVLLARMMTWATALAGTNRERYALRCKIFERVVSDPDIDDESRDIAIAYMMIRHRWKHDFLIEQSRSSDPVRRFFAHCRLTGWTNDKEEKRLHVNAAAREVDAVLERRGALGMPFRSITSIYYVDQKTLQWTDNGFIFLIRSLGILQPEMKEPLARKVFERAKVLLAEKDFKTIMYLEPHTTFLNVPEREFVAWIDELLLLKEQAPWGTQTLFGNLEKCANDIRPRIAPAPPKTASALERETLFTLSDFEQKWKLQDVKWRWREGSYDISHLYPSRLLLDNGTLWVALSGYSAYKNEVRAQACGLIAIDTATGKIISGRFGVYECHTHNPSMWSQFGQHSRPAPTGSNYKFETHFYHILPLARFGDFILVPHISVGVGVFPAKASNASDLSGVEWVDINAVPLSRPLNSHLKFFDSAGNLCFLCVDGKFIFSWKPPDKTTTAIFDANQNMTGLQLSEMDKTVEEMWFDRNTEKLIVHGRYWERGASRRDAVFTISFDPKTSKWALLDKKPERPDAESPASMVRKVLTEDNPDVFIADVAPIDDTSFYVLTGYGTKWSLEKVRMKNDK